jgi:CHAD domain-containing protein
MDETGSTRPSAVTLEEVVRGFLGRDVGRLLIADTVARAGRDDEGVHQMRVNLRHLRAEMAVVGPMLRQSATAPLTRELRWLGRRLAPRRDLDVLASLLASQREKGVPVPPPVEAAVGLDRECAGLVVTETLQSDRYRRLLARLVGAVVDPPLRSRDRALDAAEALAPGLTAATSELLGGLAAAGSTPDDATLHGLRLRSKHLRYSCHLTEGLLAGTEAAARDLEKVQGALGDLHDLVVADEYLGAFADHTPLVEPGLDETRRALAHARQRARTRWRAPLGRALASLGVAPQEGVSTASDPVT